MDVRRPTIALIAAVYLSVVPALGLAEDAGSAEAGADADAQARDGAAGADDGAVEAAADDGAAADGGLVDRGDDGGGGANSGSDAASTPLACDGALCDTTNGSMCSISTGVGAAPDPRPIGLLIVGALIVSPRLRRGARRPVSGRTLR
jgi:hypothetical protein